MSNSVDSGISNDEVQVTVRINRNVLNKITHVTGTGDYSSALTEAALTVAGQYVSKTDPDANHPFIVQDLDPGVQGSIGENISINDIVK